MIFKEKSLWEEKIVEQETLKLREFKDILRKKIVKKRLLLKNIKTKKVH